MAAGLFAEFVDVYTIVSDFKAKVASAFDKIVDAVLVEAV